MDGWCAQDDDNARAERQRRQVLDNRLREMIEGRAGAAASPYDLVTDALMGTITDQVFQALHSPDFAAALAERGYVVAPAIAAGDVPPAPDEWLHAATDLACGVHSYPDPMEQIEDLWRQAFQAGRAQRTEPPPG